MAKISQPPSQSGAGRVTRSTRSASRNVSEGPSTQTTPKKRGRKPKHKAVAGTVLDIVRENDKDDEDNEDNEFQNAIHHDQNNEDFDAVDRIHQDDDAEDEPRRDQDDDEVHDEQDATPNDDHDEDVDDGNMLIDRADEVFFQQQRGTSVASAAQTVRTGYSQEQIASLDPTMMVNELSNVASAADNMIDFLLPPRDAAGWSALWKDARTVGSQGNKIFRKRVKTLALHKDEYGEQDYIQPSVVLRALLGIERIEDVPQGKWRPDALIYKVNMAQMLRKLLITAGDPAADPDGGSFEDKFDARKQILLQLDTFFPSSIAGEAFDTQAYITSLAISTQYCIANLEQPEDDATPERIIQDALYEDGLFRHAQALHVANEEQSKRDALTRFVKEAEARLTAPFTEESELTFEDRLEKLKLQFSWPSFLNRIIRYHKMRQEQLNSIIAGAGGLNFMAHALSVEVRKWHHMREADRKRRSLGANSTPMKSLADEPGAIGSLAARMKRIYGATTQESSLAAPKATPPVRLPAPTIVAQPASTFDDFEDIAEEQSDEDEQERAQSTARSTLHQLHLQDNTRQNSRGASAGPSTDRPGVPGGKGKQRAFVDPQPFAQRVEFGDGLSQEPDSPVRTAASNHLHASNKRTFDNLDDDEDDALDFDPTQDEGFQTDERDHTAAADARRRNREISRSYAADFNRTQRPPTMPPPNMTPTAQSQARSRPSTLPPPDAPRATASGRNPGSRLPPLTQPIQDDDTPAPDMPASAVFNQARHFARRTTAQNPNKRQRQRVPWDDEENNRLMQLIERHGASWAQLKNFDEASTDALYRRSAEDIRFKARNMKLTMLLAGQDLPSANWEQVKLDKKMIDKLADNNIEYHQDAVRGG